jgi:hypothetical protein
MQRLGARVGTDNVEGRGDGVAGVSGIAVGA